MRVGVSYISLEQARANIDGEAPDGTSLEDTSAAVKAKWDAYLSLVNLTNASDHESAIFYTAMYHALQYPNEMYETNATGDFYYSGSPLRSLSFLRLNHLQTKRLLFL